MKAFMMNARPSIDEISAEAKAVPFVGAPHVTIISATNIAFVGKRYRLVDGKLDKKADGQIATGSAITISVEGPQHLADLIENLKPNDALSLGCLNAGIGVRQTLNTRAVAGENEISRSLDHFSHPVGQGWLLLDCDLGEAPDSVRQRIEELGGITKAVSHIWPDLKKAACVIRHSSSAGVALPDGTPTEAKDSRHIFVLVEDVSQSAEILKTLSQRAWAEGLGWIKLGKTGSRLNCSIIDTSVGSPERMVFEVPPILYDGLTRKPAHRP